MLQRILSLYGAIASVTVGFELMGQKRLLEAIFVFIVGIGLTIAYCFLTESDSKG